MNQEEKAKAFETVRAGGRVENHYTKNTVYDAEAALTCAHPYLRTIVCDGETDVVECTRCGDQRVAACNFDAECK